MSYGDLRNICHYLIFKIKGNNFQEISDKNNKRKLFEEDKDSEEEEDGE